MKRPGAVTIFILLGSLIVPSLFADEARPRARDIGLIVGVLPPGPLNAITDVTGVKVGHTTRVEGDTVRTGVTVVLPHSGNTFEEKVPGAVFIGNGFGKLMGSTQVNELGEIETPIALTSTLSVPTVADAILDYVLSAPGDEQVRSINPLVAETNDGLLNDGRGRHVRKEDVLNAIRSATGGPVAEGTVGAGTGTVAFGFKGGIGTASRHLSPQLGSWMVGVLVQSNFPGILTIGGAPVGKELGRYYLEDVLRDPTTSARALPHTCSWGECPHAEHAAAGSIVIVVATDAPLDHRNLMRMASRAMLGLARTGAAGVGESGDYAIAFSTAASVRITAPARLHPGKKQSPADYEPAPRAVLSNDAMSPLFLAVIEATEEAIYNSMLRATSSEGNGHKIAALPLTPTIAILREHKVLASSFQPKGSDR